MNLEQLGLVGVFIFGAIPWFEAIGVVPGGILVGLNPTLTVIAAAAGNLITIAVFAYGGAKIRSWVIARREAKGKHPKSDRWSKAQKAFDKYGIYGMAILGPLIIGTQFAAAASVAAGVRPARVTLVISIAMVLWAIAFAVLTTWAVDVGGFDTLL
jgi:nicotinamide riboside transporter PnuC